MSNPDMLRNMIVNNPQMQSMLDSNPQIRHVLNDPAVSLFNIVELSFFLFPLSFCLRSLSILTSDFYFPLIPIDDQYLILNIFVKLFSPTLSRPAILTVQISAYIFFMINFFLIWPNYMLVQIHLLEKILWFNYLYKQS